MRGPCATTPGIGLTTDKFWIGLSDRKVEMAFQWVTDESVENSPPMSGAPWGAGQPDDLTDGGEDCALIETTKLLFDRVCTTLNAYICECDAHPTDPHNL